MSIVNAFASKTDRKPVKKPAFNEAVPFFAETANTVFYDGFRNVYVTLRVDTSFSMHGYQVPMKDAVTNLLLELADKNKTAEDVLFLVKLITFNNEVHVVNEDYLEPQKLLEVIDESTFCCQGGTNLTAVIENIDQSASRSAVGFNGAHRSDMKPVNILITDMDGTDQDCTRDAAMNRVMDNQLYTRKSENLCIYVGNEKNYHYVEKLAGGKENVVGLTENFAEYITPMVMGSSVLASVETHINGTSNASLAEEAKVRAEDGNRSAAELMEEIKNLMNA